MDLVKEAYLIVYKPLFTHVFVWILCWLLEFVRNEIINDFVYRPLKNLWIIGVVLIQLSKSLKDLFFLIFNILLVSMSI